MSNLAIRIDGIGKRYRIGMLEERPETLAAAAFSVLKAPLKSFRDLRKLSAFGEATRPTCSGPSATSRST